MDTPLLNKQRSALRLLLGLLDGGMISDPSIIVRLVRKLTGYVKPTDGAVQGGGGDDDPVAIKLNPSTSANLPLVVALVRDGGTRNEGGMKEE